MKLEDVKIGQRVKTLLAFAGIPQYTEGVIDENYGSGIMVAWDYPQGILPVDYRAYDGKPAIMSKIVRDGFDKQSELQFLEVVNEEA